MKTIKKLLLSLILSQPQRQAIVDSLWFSHHTHVRRSNHIEAGKVLVIMNELKPLLKVPKKAGSESQSTQRAKDDGVAYDNGAE